MVRLHGFIALLVFTLAGFGHAAADLVAVPPLSGRIVDLSATLNADQVAQLDAGLRAFEERKGTQIAILIVPTTQPEAIEQYAIRVAEQWKIGRKKIDDGAILVVAKNDRALRIEVGYGLEGVLNDATSKRIIEEIIVPRFKSGDFYGGIDAGATAMMRVIDGEPLPPPVSKGRESDDPEQILPVVFVVALVLGGALRALFGRLPAAALTGGILGVGAWLLAGLASAAIVAAAIGFFLTLLGGRMGMLGWYGGHGHHGGGGRNGGFRGGGGGFGGGGASGRW
ncbi:TPM domain-containing protein [Herbaspirillum sp. ST 5-3]|uniref:TPM domain-containing protein n=1 Tax=Oxalobacteraceae TaxID=75682 RepID=UPI0010A41DF4|nr:TPM domain-containing protein [Herbaspirillum sp. ST 5-3]